MDGGFGFVVCGTDEKRYNKRKIIAFSVMVNADLRLCYQNVH